MKSNKWTWRKKTIYKWTEILSQLFNTSSAASEKSSYLVSMTTIGWYEINMKYTLCKNQELISVLKQGIFYANKISLTLLELAFIIYIYVYKHVVRLYSWNHRKHKTWNIIFVVTQNMQYYYNHAPEKELISRFINFKPIFAAFPWVYTMKLFFFFNRIPNLKTGYSWQDLYL